MKNRHAIQAYKLQAFQKKEVPPKKGKKKGSKVDPVSDRQQAMPESKDTSRDTGDAADTKARTDSGGGVSKDYGPVSNRDSEG
ncbi:MAG TPA: hypothetical protein VJ967_06295, partial [Clostridia bacterium]|nr:hypothetical protein [Clostridia bacterium]